MSGIIPWGKGSSTYPLLVNPLAPYQAQSQLSLEAPNSFLDWWKKVQGTTEALAPTPMQSAVTGLRCDAEGSIVGALLAIIDTDLGGLDLGGKLPLDWLGAAVFYLLSVQNSDKPDGLSVDYRAVSQSCATVASYRTVHRWREASKGILQNTPQLSGDPVLAAARSTTF